MIGAPEGKPRKYKSPAEMLDTARKYFDDCLKTSEPITITGTAMALGFNSRQAILNYEKYDGGRYHDALKCIRLACENYAERQSYKAKNPAGPIFCLKNFGWQDKQDHQLSGPEGGPIETKIEIILRKPNES